MDEFKVLKKIDLFNNLDEIELNEVVSSGKTKVFNKNSIIFREGELASGAFIILEGKVKIFKLGSDGREHILHIFEAGKIFAESAMFAGTTYPAFAQSLKDCTIFYIEKSKFLYLIEKRPSLAMKMLASQASRLRIFAAKIENLSLKEVSVRLARYLVEQVEIENKDIDKDIKLKLKMTKTQLASYLGTISETLSRTLTSFKNKGLIDEVNGKFHIYNFEALKKLSDS